MIGATSIANPSKFWTGRVTAIAWPVAALILLTALQFFLIFSKSYNWDEFLHYSMVYQLHEGTLARPFQTLLARLLGWIPGVSDDLMTQMAIARAFAWSAFLVGLSAMYGLARQFGSKVDALWTTLIYFGAGSVFVHGFAIRTDPLAMAGLMLSLYLLAARKLDMLNILTVGFIVGFVGLLTVKSIFYAPCFAGIAWLRFANAENKKATVVRILAIVPVAITTFVGLYFLHRAGLAPTPLSQQGPAFVSNGVKWLTDGLLRQPYYTLMAFLTAPLFVYALLSSPAAWRTSGLSRPKTLALVGLALPLLTILFYRNAFPYFFVFIFAPVAVALTPAVAMLRARFGPAVLFALICIVPLGKFMTEPRQVMDGQEALIEYVHRQFPDGALYFDYCGIIADYPRVIDHLISGIGLKNYHARGVPLVAQAVQRGELAFVVANRPAIVDALTGKQSSDEKLLPADVAALRGNYVRVGGGLWLAGEMVPAGPRTHIIHVPHRGTYIANSSITVNGVTYRRGSTIDLDRGHHNVASGGNAQAILWRGTRLPEPVPTEMTEEVFTKF
ncbi:MAG: hypothetical protein IBJ12_04485 [Sphingomonadaceae bacterium]|nr:hypothetical protein [Sphingomonadaceae bacterium]